MNEEERITQIEERIPYHFEDRSLILTALTHSSYVNERKINKRECNERLEFLGDAVLELISSEFIYERYHMPEGQMTRLRASLVCEESLSGCAKDLGLGELLYLGKGEENCGGRRKASVTSDAFEALLGAMYLDGGLEAVREFVVRVLLSQAEKHAVDLDSKTRLQERVQSDGKQHEIVYRVTDISGPEHDRLYTVELEIDKKIMGRGSGKNKKLAEKAAAADALEKEA